MATFLESPRFPDKIAFGAIVGPTYSTVVSTVYSGRESRIVAWGQSKINFEVGLRAMTAADTATIDAFFRAVKGRAYGFRIKDWTDFTDNGAGVLIAQSTPGLYQMGKLYTQGALSETRTITKPVAGSISAILNGSTLSSGVSVDSTTGLVTISPLASASVTGITVGSSTIVTLASALSGLAVGGLLYLSNLGGADAGLLNGQQFTISAISGSQYTLSVNTAGKTITVGSGVGAKYPQPTDILSWAGQFDVPARFDVDEMKKQIEDRSGTNGDLVVTWGSIPIVEIRI
ncbi:DUF2460 domain-containing protein [Burkholderia ubonensis]|uniref:DUF2460 domain-containing protein n=1 Tax=Burkholderia ubonensis TaxID=101571 RepID=UPI00075A4E49|nr:DUF2460 domain-containing protein [Burkholderia ubonensis]KVO11714.1 hypothetical protein WJ73_19380 [Burkholderia ubonensis]